MPANAQTVDSLASVPPAENPKKPSRGLFWVKLAVSAAALTFTLSQLSLKDLKDALGRLSAAPVTVAISLTLFNLVLAGLRWRVLLAAYGAKSAPSLAFLARAQIVGHFYNTFVPGNVTGDVLRAHATRTSFDGPLGSYMVVGIERFFGLAGLFTLGAASLLIHPLPGVMRADLLALLAAGTAFAIVLIPILGRRLGRFLPGKIGGWAGNLPAPARPALLGVVLAMSIVTHTLVALTGHVLIDAVAPQVAPSESMVLVPLAMVATYVPFSVAGLGVREAAFVFLFGRVGVDKADATAASLAFLAVYSIVAAMGGLLHLVRPLQIEKAAKQQAD
ncbi:MAG: flippase-like domain-containing protein [Polyangiaceae bacterium]|nr:flippase-like domain-containing protein [Polyangiaceae bacterium]